MSLFIVQRAEGVGNVMNGDSQVPSHVAVSNLLNLLGEASSAVEKLRLHFPRHESEEARRH